MRAVQITGLTGVDSLSREFVGYMISIYGMPDTQKFEHSDSMLNKTRIRMTFQSWQDMLVLGPAVEGDDNRRSEYFLKLTLDHFNLLEANTSAPLVDLALNLVDELNTTELTAPDVFVMNPAAAYAIFQQTVEVGGSPFVAALRLVLTQHRHTISTWQTSWAWWETSGTAGSEGGTASAPIGMASPTSTALLTPGPSISLKGGAKSSERSHGSIWMAMRFPTLYEFRLGAVSDVTNRVPRTQRP